MNSNELLSILLAPLSLSYGFMILLLGLYSLTFNVADAHHKNHPRSEKIARKGGWLYIFIGTAMMMQQLING